MSEIMNKREIKKVAIFVVILSYMFYISLMSFIRAIEIGVAWRIALSGISLIGVFFILAMLIIRLIKLLKLNK